MDLRKITEVQRPGCIPVQYRPIQFWDDFIYPRHPWKKVYFRLASHGITGSEKYFTVPKQKR